jgi:hypothetical protein
MRIEVESTRASFAEDSVVGDTEMCQDDSEGSATPLNRPGAMSEEIKY